jgi:hypothetical protein
MRASWFTLAALAACSSDAPLSADAPTTGTPDGPPAKNPAVLWLAGINGSEVNLELRADGPPSPY